MRHLTLVIAALTLTTACGGPGDSDTDTSNGTDALVESGHYTLDFVSAGSMTVNDFGNLTIDVDVTALTATLTLQDSSTVPLTLTATPSSQWIADCYVNGPGHMNDEVYTVSSDPTVVDTLSIPTPILTTKCGGRLLLTSMGSGAVVDPTLGFTK